MNDVMMRERALGIPPSGYAPRPERQDSTGEDSEGSGPGESAMTRVRASGYE